MLDYPYFQETITLILSIIATLTGIAALLLSIYNYRLAARFHRLHVRVQPYLRGVSLNEQRTVVEVDVTIEVVNDSYFEVIIDEIGLVTKPGRFSRRGFFPLQFTFYKGLGKRLPPRDRQIYHAPLKSEHMTANANFFANEVPTFPTIEQVQTAYITLVTGQRFTGERHALNDLPAIARNGKKHFVKH